jgi:hypothetical protein
MKNFMVFPEYPIFIENIRGIRVLKMNKFFYCYYCALNKIFSFLNKKNIQNFKL